MCWVSARDGGKNCTVRAISVSHVLVIYNCCELFITQEWCSGLERGFCSHEIWVQFLPCAFSLFNVYSCSLFILCLTRCHIVEVCSKIFRRDCPHCTLISQEILKKSTETYILICRELKARSICMFSFSLLHIFRQLFFVKLWIKTYGSQNDPARR